MAQRDTYENVDLNRGSFNDTRDRVHVSSAFDFINQTHAAIIIKVMRGLGMRKDPSRRNISGKKKYHVAPNATVLSPYRMQEVRPAGGLGRSRAQGHARRERALAARCQLRRTRR
jgi:hypothetical protein